MFFFVLFTLSLSLSFSCARTSRSLLASSRSASRCWSLAVSWTFLSLASDSSSVWNIGLKTCLKNIHVYFITCSMFILGEFYFHNQLFVIRVKAHREMYKNMSLTLLIAVKNQLVFFVELNLSYIELRRKHVLFTWHYLSVTILI